jgi:hypothetical protein
MDNKQNRQFYWEVKDFLQRKQPEQIRQQSSLYNTVTNIMESRFNKHEPNYYEARQEIVNSSNNTQKAVLDVLNSYSYKMIFEKPSCKGYSGNITTNFFNIK